MCCLFTCCAWVVDAIQRAWVFAMTCCVCSAICFMMIIASVSGVALGYNYSLAEYVELKETNISVFLKRGVFDDTIVDDLDWRRGGGGPPAAERSGSPSAGPAQESEYNAPAADDLSLRKSMMSPDDNDYSPPPGKRLDDSIIMADNNRRFEGALMKLTGAAANLATTLGWDVLTETITSNTHDRGEGVEFSPSDKIQAAYEEQRKVQGLINRQKLEMYPTPLHGPPTTEIAKRITETMYGSTYALPFQARRMDIGANPVTDPSMDINAEPRFVNPDFLKKGDHPPGPSGEFYKNWVHGLIKPAGHLGDPNLSPIEKFKNEMEKAGAGPFMTDSAFIYNTAKTTRTTPNAYEDVSQIDKKIDDKSDSDYDEEDVKGLPMRRKRDVSYLSSVMRIPNQLTKEAETDEAYKSKADEDHTELMKNKIKPKGNKLESITKSTIFRNLGTKSSSIYYLAM